MKRPTGPAHRPKAEPAPPTKKERKAAKAPKAPKVPKVAKAPKAERAVTAPAATKTAVSSTSKSSSPSAPSSSSVARKKTPAERAQASRMRKARHHHEVDDASEAKRKLREATRARKAFERDEVRRFTAHLRRRRNAWLTALGALGAVLLFVALGVFTPLMSLQEVVIEGTTRVNAAQIQAALQSEINKPLPLVDQATVEKAVAAQPLVKSFSVESLPPHTLLIKIVERQPAGYLPTAEGFTMVDAAGVVMETTPERIPGVPLFTVEGDSAKAPGFEAGLNVLHSLPAALAGQIDEVIAKTTDDVIIVLSGTGARVFWGGPENAALKSKVLASLLAVNPVGSVSEYDVSSPNTAVVR